MGFWEAVVTIVALGCAVALFETWSKARGAGRAAQRDIERLEQALAAQAERLASLEEIVVDGRYDLRRELDQLDSERAAR